MPYFQRSCRYRKQLYGIIIFIVFSIGYPQISHPRPQFQQPHEAAISSSVVFTDDQGRESMLAGLEKSISYWQKKPLNQKVTICSKEYSAKDLLETLNMLQTIFGQSRPLDLNRNIHNNFTICQANSGKDILVTGYYQPTFQGSRTRSPPYIYPLYKIPDDLLSYKDNKTAEKSLGRRLPGGRIVPYWSRGEIEDRGLLQGQEIVFLKDPMEAFTLHIQGSGLIRLRDGTLRAILFAASNGRKYQSIGKLLVNEHRIPLAEISMAKITAYLNEHVDERQRILHYNKRYIFFRWGHVSGDHGVFGSMGSRLIPGRSAALDKKILPLGMAAFLMTEQPVFNATEDIVAWKPLRRLVLHQDSGSAIKGSGRLDLFWGRGDAAGKAAGVMKQPGQLYFLIKKR